MAAVNGKPRGRPPYNNSKTAPSEPGDEEFTYTRTQLVRFDNRFRARLLRAFQKGLESRESAANQLSVTRSACSYRPRALSSSLESAALRP
jgi:hypothetical protein